MKKIFFVAGELSGDMLGAWYITKHLSSADTCRMEGVGGNALQAAGVHLFDRIESLNIVGIIEVVKHIPRLLRYIKRLVTYIINEDFDEVILIDFPGFNLRVAKQLKHKKPSLKITYLSPPQLWCWGQWRLKTLKRYIDLVIVLYPFEVAWYKERGVNAVWLGNPVYDRLFPYLEYNANPRPIVGLFPGSRKIEVESLLPVMASVVRQLHKMYPEISFFIPRPRSLSEDFFYSQLEKVSLIGIVKVIDDEEEKMKALRECCFALTKPGTVTLELALLNVPALVMYKTSLITYYIAKSVVHIKHMALPNLLLGDEVYPEFIQQLCKPGLLLQEAQRLYQHYAGNTGLFRQQKNKLTKVKDLFSNKTHEI